MTEAAQQALTKSALEQHTRTVGELRAGYDQTIESIKADAARQVAQREREITASARQSAEAIVSDGAHRLQADKQAAIGQLQHRSNAMQRQIEDQELE